jgi:hypothetical protein
MLNLVAFMGSVFAANCIAKKVGRIMIDKIF